jgi:hypothetical protein
MEFGERSQLSEMTGMTNFNQMDKKTYKMFGVYMQPKLREEIDIIRGDIPRSRWLSKAAIRELERQKKEMLLNGVPDHSAATSLFSVVISTASHRLPTHGDSDTDER